MTRLHAVCQNPECNVLLDEVVPPLRVDAQTCSRACRDRRTILRREPLEGVICPERFWQGIAARRTRESRTTGRMRQRARKQAA
jgi:hypothetical protein